MPHTHSTTSGGLTITHTDHPRGKGQATAFGGHVLGWQPAGHEPVLYLSPRAVLDGSKPIRGGIPVCFPWFGAGPSGDREPAHGLVRSVEWEPGDCERWWVGYFHEVEGWDIHLTAAFGPLEGVHPYGAFQPENSMNLFLAIKRTGEEPAPFEVALHTYFSVSGAAGVTVEGLGEARCFDQLTGKEAEDGIGSIRFDGEYDRIFTGIPGRKLITLTDPGLSRRITIDQAELPSAIVWNPGPAKAASMSDLGEDQHEKFVCIESGRVRQDALTLEPGEAFEAEVRFTVERLEG